MSLTLQPELENKLRERAESEGLTVEAYVERLIWVEEATNDRLVELALEGINSGAPVSADSEFWEERRRELARRLSKMGA
jgi:predicted kinase